MSVSAFLSVGTCERQQKPASESVQDGRDLTLGKSNQAEVLLDRYVKQSFNIGGEAFGDECRFLSWRREVELFARCENSR